MPAGSAAATESREYHIRYIRSMNHMIDQNAVCTISGSATASTSRPPHGRDHQLESLAGAPQRGSGVFCGIRSSMF